MVDGCLLLVLHITTYLQSQIALWYCSEGSNSGSEVGKARFTAKGYRVIIITLNRSQFSGKREVEELN